MTREHLANPDRAARVGDAFSAAVEAFSAAAAETPRLDAEVLLEHATGLPRTRFAAEPELPMPKGSAREFAEFVRRRVAHEPVAYITGVKGFRHLLVECDARALVPRPETELLVDVAHEFLDDRDGAVGAESGDARPLQARVADLGTGSGALALALADEIEGCEVIATDISPGALALARHNAHRLGLGDRISFVEGSVPEGSFDLVLANLPYVGDDEWAALAPEIREWEPREALAGGPDGLNVIRDVIAQIGPPGSGTRCESPLVALEIGQGQGKAVCGLLGDRGFGRVEVRPDLAGIERVVIAGHSAT